MSSAGNLSGKLGNKVEPEDEEGEMEAEEEENDNGQEEVEQKEVEQEEHEALEAASWRPCWARPEGRATHLCLGACSTTS